MSIKKVEFNDANFDDEIREGLSVVCFGDPNDSECRRQSKIMEQAADALEGQIRIGSCMIDHCSALAERLCITSIPTILVFKDGREVERLVGFRHECTLEKHLRQDVSADS